MFTKFFLSFPTISVDSWEPAPRDLGDILCGVIGMQRLYGRETFSD